MEVNVLETGDMVRVLEIKATASDLETDVRLALRKLQSATTLRGFRPGRVPIKMIRRMRREDVKNEIVDNLTKEVFEDMVKSSDQYRLLGTPREIRRDYELDEDLLVQVEFNVVPQVELQDVTGQVLEIPVSGEITERVIEFFVRKRMSANLVMRPLEEGEKIGEGAVGMLDRVEFRITEIDSETGMVLIGSDSEVEVFEFGDPEDLETEIGDKCRAAFTGRAVGDKVHLDYAENGGLRLSVTEVESYFQAEILEAFRFEWPEIDDGWATIISREEVDSAEKLWDWVREYLSMFFGERNRNVMDFLFMGRMHALHPINIPASLAEEMRKNLLDEWGDNSRTQDALQGQMEHLQWLILREAIKGQVDLKSSEELVAFRENETKPKAGGKVTATSELPSIDPLTTHLLQQFEVRKIPLDEDHLIYIIANEF